MLTNSTFSASPSTQPWNGPRSLTWSGTQPSSGMASVPDVWPPLSDDAIQAITQACRDLFEDHVDLQDGLDALAEIEQQGTVPWDQVRRDLGL